MTIVRALTSLIVERRFDAVRTSDIITAAGVARSTFYEHFRSKDDVLLAAIDPVLLPLANAASGRADKVVVRCMLVHVWDHRSLARIVLDSAVGGRLQRKLAKLIDARLQASEGVAPPAALAMATAAGQLTMLRMWITGEVRCSAETLAKQLVAYSALFVRERQAAARRS